MAVIFAVVGGGAVIGIVANYSDHSDYSDYDNYSDYSDAAERKQRRIDAKKNEIDSQKNEINAYKTSSVNSYLQSQALKQESGVSVNILEVKEDGDKKIEYDIKAISDRESAELKLEIDEIDAVINKIDKILREGE